MKETHQEISLLIHEYFKNFSGHETNGGIKIQGGIKPAAALIYRQINLILRYKLNVFDICPACFFFCR